MPSGLGELLAKLPPELRERALTHSSWTSRRLDSYGRLAFLGDSVLGLAVAEELFARFPEDDIGRLTKIHGQAVSGRACAEVADVLGLPGLVRELEPAGLEGAIAAEDLLRGERAIASVCEAVIGACALEYGYEPTAAAVVAAFQEQVDLACETLLDFKSALQERLAQAGRRVEYRVVGEDGPAHARRFEIEAAVDSEILGRGEGRNKKEAEQAAAQQALAGLE
ncbi:MAG: ribonuclease III family protein [Solirubrobacterales bacterium]